VKPSKLTELDEAIRQHVPDGSSVLMGAALEASIPFAAGYELVRQGRQGLTLIAPISDMLFDVLIGAGVANRAIAAWVGNVSAGSGYNFRRAVEQSVPHPLEMVDHSNLTLALSLHAAAMGVPYLPTHSTLGTDLLAGNPHLQTTRCPFTSDLLVAVEALTPDVAILPVQACDAEGNCHVVGNLGVVADAARAARTVMVMTEEIVSPERIRSDPNRTLIPGFLVNAVVEVPMGCHPSPCQGHYGRDHVFFHDYHEASRKREGFDAWLERWVLSLADHRAYLDQLGHERLEALRGGASAP
jgi:glutaconate CoA-transferase subunit A